MDGCDDGNGVAADGDMVMMMMMLVVMMMIW